MDSISMAVLRGVIAQPSKGLQAYFGELDPCYPDGV
jgi:hypothetical protein